MQSYPSTGGDPFRKSEISENFQKPGCANLSVISSLYPVRQEPTIPDCFHFFQSAPPQFSPCSRNSSPFELPRLKKVRDEIAGDSDIVDIRTTEAGVRDEKKPASYTIGQYALFQEGEIRFQMSQGWTWRGMTRDWKHAVRKHTRQERGLYKVDFKGLLTDWFDFVKSKKIIQMPLIEVKVKSKIRSNDGEN